MDERQRRIEALYEAALEHPPAQRQEFLAQACGTDEELHAEIASLVSAYGRAGNFLEGWPVEAAGALLGASPVPGQRIGPYRLLQLLGAGGMAVVYLAERDDEQFTKHVALKLIRPGIAGADALRRFRHERQILASLEHPHIARLLDGGATADGLPWYVMEYVEGEPITTFCEGRSLPLRDRLRLVHDVCSAVEFAHRNLVVHRDIKPGNILVTPGGTVKLLDFGIARLLTPEPGSGAEDLTATAYRVMTPAYASPEQVRGDRLTTATDVYSLGVVLYELLTGQRPYRLSDTSPSEVARVVCSQEPERPSTAVRRAGRLARELRGDLDNIAAKAMAKEPARRYASAGELASDISHYLEGRPVAARGDSFAYRAGKFIRRHRAGSAAAALVLLAIAAGTAATAWQAQVARAERVKAERRFDDVRRLANSFLFEFDEAIRNVQGTTPARELIIRRGLEYLNKLASESGDEAGLKRELAAAYEKVSDIQGNIHGPNLGDQKAALDSCRRALALRESLVAARPGDAEAERDLASSYSKTAELMWLTSDSKGAAEMSRKHLALVERLREKGVMSSLTLAKAYTQHGWMAMATTGDEKALGANVGKALPLLEPLVAAEPHNVEARNALGRAYELLAGSLGNAREVWPEVLRYYHKSLEAHLAAAGAEPRNPVYSKAVAGAYNDLAHAYQFMGRPKEAVKYNRESLRVLERMAAADPGNKDLSRAIAIAANGLASALVDAGEPAAALPYLKQALAGVAAIPDQSTIIVSFMRALVSYNLGRAYAAIGQRAEARTWLERSAPVLADLKKRGITVGEEAALADKAAAQLAALR